MQVRPILKSCLLHLVLAALLFFGLRSSHPAEEVPIELVEFLKAKPSGPRAPPRAPSKSVPSESASTSVDTSLNPAPSGAPDSRATGQSAGEGVAEEYEVSELPALIREVRVPYPPSAKARGVQGTVVFDLIVNSRGEVQSAKIVKSPAPELTEAAQGAIGRFRFRPARIGDKAVAIQIRYTYRFILE
jgi:TonB family protein